MKGNTELIATLNDLLAEELTAINQYMVHAEMCESWGYTRLHAAVRQRAIVEMRHAEALISRILFLDGMPNVGELRQLHIGGDVRTQIANDLAAERSGVEAYNDAIALAMKVRDNVTRELLQGILKDEDLHVDELERYHDQIEQMGYQTFLSTLL